MNKNSSPLMGSLLIVAAIAFLVPLLIPLPGTVIDFCIVISFGVAITVYLRSSTIREWAQFKTFPTLVLLAAVFRISLNISTTKKILLDGQPGGIIEQFGNLVIGSNPGLGFVIFIIIIVVQFIIANGASRLSEVSARFTLDALPGKQMSIDADLNSGSINLEEAKKRRRQLDMQVDFFGSMDGAGKFVKGDVMLGIIVIFVNIIGGLVRGMMFMGMSFTDALNRFTLLTIGDGIVNQLCSLLITVGSAIVMTRVYDDKNASVMGNIMDELIENPIITYVVGGLFGVFGIIGMFTQLPAIPFLVMSGLMFYIGFRKQTEYNEKTKKEEQDFKKQADEEQAKEKNEVKQMTEVDPITLEVGLALIPVVNADRNANGKKETISDKITLMRKNFAHELGIRIPKIRIVDDSAIMPYTRYNIKIKDSLVASGELKLNSLLALKTPYVVKEIEGIPTLDPIFKDEAIWITEDVANEAKDNGYQVVDPLSILSNHLSETIKANIHELLERQEVHEMIQEVGKKHKVLVEEINKQDSRIDLSLVQTVLKNLLREGISVRDLPTILEGIIDGSKLFEQSDEVTMIVREKISKQICEINTNFDQKIHVLLLPQELELSTDKTIKRHDGYHLNLNIMEEMALMNSIKKQVNKAMMADLQLVIYTNRNELRFAMARMIHRYGLHLSVMMNTEFSKGTVVEKFGVLQMDEDAA